ASALPLPTSSSNRRRSSRRAWPAMNDAASSRSTLMWAVWHRAPTFSRRRSAGGALGTSFSRMQTQHVQQHRALLRVVGQRGDRPGGPAALFGVDRLTRTKHYVREAFLRRTHAARLPATARTHTCDGGRLSQPSLTADSTISVPASASMVAIDPNGIVSCP